MYAEINIYGNEMELKLYYSYPPKITRKFEMSRKGELETVLSLSKTEMEDLKREHRLLTYFPSNDRVSVILKLLQRLFPNEMTDVSKDYLTEFTERLEKLKCFPAYYFL